MTDQDNKLHREDEEDIDRLRTKRSRKVLPLNRISRRSDTGIYVKHISKCQNEDPMVIPHRDDYYMFTVLTEGEADVVVDFKNLNMQKGEGMILAPGQIHYPKTGKPVPTAWSLFVSSDHLSPLTREIVERYSLTTAPIRFDPGDLSDLEALYEITKRNIRFGEFSRAMVVAITDLFCRSIQPEAGTVNDRYVAIVLRFKRLLEELSSIERRPCEYASRLHISRVYLNEAVKSVTGMNVISFINNYMALSAKRLLMHTTLSVSEIAAKLGYDDYSYFSRMFRKETGVTPTEFRKNLV